MSAYICSPSHIGILAAYAALNDCAIQTWRTGIRFETAQAVAKGLAQENIRSVAHRYPNDKDGHRPGPPLCDASIIEASAMYAGHYISQPQQLTPVQVLKLCDCLSYQSCETDDWEDTLAAKQLRWIKNEAEGQLPGWEDAKWEWDDCVEEINVLFYDPA
jgi:hypothetical protein